jgi:GTP cyclohydrolase I
MISSLKEDIINYSFNRSVEVLGTSLCPCSKEISSSGAHNQRSRIKIECSPSEFLWIEDVVEIAEKTVSCQIYSVLKRTDEKYVTEMAYNNPAFVEDIVRQCYYEMLKICHLKWVTVEVRNEESIHSHDAFARISSKD